MIQMQQNNIFGEQLRFSCFHFSFIGNVFKCGKNFAQFKGNKSTPRALHDLNVIVATLALGSRPRQRLARVQAKKEARESHLMLPGM
jgi:hypothetical protein